MASTEYMNRQTKVIIFIIAGFLVLAGIIMVISFLFSSKSNETSPTPQPTVQPEDTPVLTDAANDYSKDKGYIKLPEDFDPAVSDTTNTVYNDEYAYLTMNSVLCELSQKQVITEKSLEPLTNLVDDFSVNGSAFALTAKEQMNEELEWFRERIGEEIPPDKKSDLKLLYCDIQEDNEDGYDRN